MKKYLPANKWLLKTAALVLFTASLLVIHSCKKDLTKQEQALTDPDIIQAKSWYQSAFPAFAKQSSNGAQLISTSASGSATTELDQYIDPDWANTNKYNRFNKNVYEIPVNPDNKFAAALKNANTGKLYGDKANSKTSFLILKDDAGYHAYVMTIIADSAYLKGDLTKLARNSYAKRDTDFSGLVLYFTPKGVYLNGYAYKNGHLIIPSSSSNQSPDSKQVQTVDNNKKVSTLTACTDWYLDEYVNDVLVSSQYKYTTCEDDGSGGGGGGGGSGSTGGGSGNSGPTPPPQCPAGASVINNGKVNITTAAPVQTPIGDDGGDGGFPPPAPSPQPCTVITSKPAGGGTPGTTPIITVNVDSIKKYFPCAYKLIIDSLSKITAYANLIAPFTTTKKPDLIWENGTLPWNAATANSTINTYQLGVTSSTGRSSIITLNTSMLQQSSQLLITSAAIHETLHAYINYLIETNVNFTPPATYNGTQPWIVSLDYWALQNGLPSNYRDHFEMLSDYFDKAVGILKAWDNSAHTDQEYQMLMLFGLNTNDFLALPTGNPASLSVEYNNLLTKYNITPAMLNTYWNTQLTSTTNKLPSGCPI